ncbi:MAG TPA: hypothetical protein VFU59_00415 [Candidatus Eisenbacteria bacterium]|nr:hypothetical protein [Candidatus Eisenbacteria bacterium]
MKPFRSLVAALALGSLTVALAAPLAVAQTAAPATPTAPAKTAAPAKAAATTAAPATAAATSSKGGVTTGIKTIVGEVVDPACWIVNGAKGETHKECTIACAKAGQVLAILEAKTNKLYLLATENPGEDPNKGVVDFAGMKVTVTGKFYTRGGVTAVKISSITPGGAK